MVSFGKVLFGFIILAIFLAVFSHNAHAAVNATFNMTLNDSFTISTGQILTYATADGMQELNLTTNETRDLTTGTTYWMKQCTVGMGGTLTGTLSTHQAKTLQPGDVLTFIGNSPLNFGKVIFYKAYNKIKLLNGEIVPTQESPGGPNNHCGT